MNVSYFLRTFLTKNTAKEARDYLGIGGGDSGDVTESDLDFSDVTTANSTAAQHGLLPKLSGNAGDVFKGDGTFSAGGGGSGDVVGPASAVDDRIATFDGATGKLIQDSGSGIAVVPTANQKAALAGTDGAPAAGNPYVTDSDPRLVSSGGTVTSVAISTPSILSVSGSPVTTAGTLALTLANQNANLVFAGPATGAAAAPTMRALVAADFPSTSQPWDTIITKSADQVVTNNSTLQDDTELFTPLVANAFYEVEMFLIYSSNNGAGDIKCAFGHPDLTGLSAFFAMGLVSYVNSALSAVVQTFSGAATKWPTSDLICGSDSGGLNLAMTSIIKFSIKTLGVAGDLQFKFCNNGAAIGRTTTTWAGTTLRVKRLF